MARRQTSFSRKVKDEIFSVKPQNLCCYRSELAAIFHLRGFINIQEGKQFLSIMTDSSASSRYIFKLLKELLMINPVILHRNNKKKSGAAFILQVIDEAAVKRIFSYLGVKEKEGFYITPRVNPDLLKNDCCRRSYIRGGFVAGGSVNDPRIDYHLEIYSEHEVYARKFLELMALYGIKGAWRSRKKGYYIYLKNSEAIMDFFKVIRAYNILFEIEDTKILKSKVNQANRMLNCDIANVNKTVLASKEQVHSIEIIQRTIGLKKLSPSLAAAAEARLENTEMSLIDLGEFLEPPVSKSGMSYRMKALNRIAKKLAEKGKFGNE